MAKFKFSKLTENGGMKLLKGRGEKGDAMRAHLSDRDAFLLILKGEIDFRLGTNTLPLTTDDFMEIPAQEIHAFEVRKSCELLLILDREARMTFVE